MHVNALQALSSPILEGAVSLVPGERDDKTICSVVRTPRGAEFTVGLAEHSVVGM